MQRPAAICLSIIFVTTLAGADWRQFRGNDFTGVALDEKAPLEWSADKNIAWKASLPGRGLSGPIVVGDSVFLTASSGPQEERLHVFSFDAASGETLWERQFWATGSTMHHPKTAIAASNPVSDGQRVFALFSSNDLACLDLDGNLLWFRGLTLDFPNARNSLGMAASPIVVGKTLIVQIEADAEAHALGIDVESGLNRWQIERPEAANWTSPTVLKGKTPTDHLVLLQSSKGVDAVVPDTGEIVWSYGQGASTIPSSVVLGDVAYVPSNGLTALRPAFGRSEPEVLWQDNRLSPGTATPLVLGDRVYIINRSGVLTSGDIKTGEIASRVRLEGPFTSTPVATATHIYAFSENGLGQVVEIGEELKLVGQNNLGEEFLCTPAIANGAIYIRSHRNLWKIAE